MSRVRGARPRVLLNSRTETSLSPLPDKHVSADEGVSSRTDGTWEWRQMEEMMRLSENSVTHL